MERAHLEAAKFKGLRGTSPIRVGPNYPLLDSWDYFVPVGHWKIREFPPTPQGETKTDAGRFRNVYTSVEKEIETT